MKFFLLVFTIFFASSTFAAAHSLEGRTTHQDTAVVVAFNYSSGEAARFIEANVFSPENSDIEFQTGRTDMRGQVVFSPDTSGEWKVIVKDNQGHRAETLVSIESNMPTESGASSSVESASASMPFKIALGMSLILNLAFLFGWMAKRKQEN